MVKEYLLALLTAGLGVAVRFIQQWLATRLKPAQYETVLNLARTVVSAADKIGKDFGVDNKAKYDFAKNVVQTGARKVGLKLTDNEAMAFIHAALKELRELENLPEYPGFPEEYSGPVSVPDLPDEE